MDLHLQQRAVVRALNHLGAATSGVAVSLRGNLYQNIHPNLDAMPCYPDCDMITRVHPRMLLRFAAASGCKVERLETYFFLCDKAPKDSERTRLGKLERHWFYRFHGDHILFIGTKEEKG